MLRSASLFSPMTDLLDVLPDFDIKPYRHLTHSLEKNDVSVAELISLDPVEIAKRCPLPLGDLRSLVQAVVRALQHDLGIANEIDNTGSELSTTDQHVRKNDFVNDAGLTGDGTTVKTLDTEIDRALGGGFRTGHITEIVGESAVGKTQFVLGLLLSVQLQAPQGLGRSAIYLSTEAPLNTTRLQQMLQTHPVYQTLRPEDRPSLDCVHTISTNDLETQEHIVRYQLPLAVSKFNVGLIVMDSVTANFRAEHETRDAKGLADRAVDLARLGTMLRHIAKEHNVAVVVTNQVSDRFDDLRTAQDRILSSPSIMSSSPMLPPRQSLTTKSTPRDECLSLDHQQRFFTGWGDQRSSWSEQLKTPALGMAWANQLSARVILKMESERMNQHPLDYAGGNIWSDRKKRRFVGTVFAPWAAPTLQLVEYEIVSQGAISVSQKASVEEQDGESTHNRMMLDPQLWFDGAAEDEEFP